MRIGCCVNMVARTAERTGAEAVGVLKEIGFDYVELPLAQVTALSDEQFECLRLKIQRSGIPCEAFNNFFPDSVRLTGPDLDLREVMNYATLAMRKAASLGAKIIVFGSGPAKMVPPGFSSDMAREQLVNLLSHISIPAGEMGLTVVIEPLRRQECNIINTAAEGLSLVRAVGSKNVRLLIDFYHLTAVGDSCEIIEAAADHIYHIHLAKPICRSFPSQADSAQYEEFFDSLNAIDYQGRISIEAYSGDLPSDAEEGLTFLRSKFSTARSTL